MFRVVPELRIGSVVEVSGTSVRVELDGNPSELTRVYQGHVYSVGQIASLIKIHQGRQVLLARVKRLRMRSELADEDPEDIVPEDSRILEADLFGEGNWTPSSGRFNFNRGIQNYPLPGQDAYLTTREELREIYAGAQRVQADGLEEEERLIDFGTYFGTESAPCKLDADKLFAQHSAVVGATGSGKSATVAALLNGLLEWETRDESEELRPRVVLIDPHGEYADAFGNRAIVYQAYDSHAATDDSDAHQLRLPIWVMGGEELRSIIIGKTEHAATSEDNIVRKALRHARLSFKGWIDTAQDWEDEEVTKPEDTDHPAEPRIEDDKYKDRIRDYNPDTPDPFSLDEFENHIYLEQALQRGGRGTPKEWKRKSSGSHTRSIQSVLDKLRTLRADPRLRFLMSGREPEDEGAELEDILLQFTGTPEGTDGADIRIIDLSGLPNEVAGPLTATVARLLFRYKTWQTREERRRDPILFACEEAHRYVPNKPEAEFKAAQSAIRRLAKEGRKYGIGVMLISQRPADVEETVLSQCNSWVVMRLTNPTDQDFVRRFVPDTFAGLTDLLPVLGRREALVLGTAAAMPARVQVRLLESDQLPDSHDVSFLEGWSRPPMEKEDIRDIIARWKDEDEESDAEDSAEEASAE